MKFVLRIIPTIVLLISISAFADTIRFGLNTNVAIGPNEGTGDNVGVTLSGQGVFIFALGGTPTFWFDTGQPYFPGEGGLGPTSIFWDTAGLKIGSTLYDFDQFDLAPTGLNAPNITFPSNGKGFTVSFPWTPELFGTINSNCPSSGCNFDFVGKPGTVRLSFFFLDGTYYANTGSFTTVPEPGTLTLIGIGIGVVGWRRFKLKYSDMVAEKSITLKTTHGATVGS